MTKMSKFYLRQKNLVGLDGQEKLSASKVLVIGAGGLGCPVLSYLAAAGVGHIGILDHDVVEISNLNRQILYTPEDAGRNKAEVAALKIRNQNPFIEVSTFCLKISKASIDEVFLDFEIIVDCTDNFETKFLVHDACFRQNKKLVQASIYQYEGNLHVFDFSNLSAKGPCLRCLWTSEPDDGRIGTCSTAGVLGATAGVLGSLQGMEVLKMILNRPTLKNGEGLFVDLISNDFEKQRWSKNDLCSICSGKNHMDKNGIQAQKSEYRLSYRNVSADMIWIDLRSENEVEEFKINKTDLIEMPLSKFDISRLKKEVKYLLICQNGYRSHQVAKSLRELGHDNFFSLIDGIQNIKK